jgi:HEAT repeat protein
MHYNGRVREAAVRELARRSTTPFSLAVLILRANDWVEPVRTPAIAAVRDSLTLQRRAEWMPLLGAIAAITTRSRADNTWILDRIRAIFAQPEGHSLLLEALNSPDRHTARFAFTAVAILPPAERATFIAAGLRNADPVVRLRTAQAIKSSLDTPDRDALIDHMSRDAHMPVRREALYAMLAAPDEPKRRHLLAMLLDPHTSIRHAARVYLRDIPGSPDPREFYIAALADHSSPSLAAAIAGLGDTGSRGDADILAPFATHASPRVGTAAIRAVTRLDPDQRTDWLLSFLANPRPALAAAAARTLRPRAGSLNPDHLRSLVHQSPHPHSRQCALTLLLRRQPFDAAVEAIAAAASPDPAIASHALAHLEGLRKTSVSLGPTESQIQAFSLSISRFGGSLPPHSLDSACHLFGLRPPAAR